MRYEDLEKNVEIIGENIQIGENVTFGNNVKIIGKSVDIGNNVSFGNNIDVHIKGSFSIDVHSHLGTNAQIRGNKISFGKHLFNSSGLRIGGGGRQHPRAIFSIGDRCTIHNNFINVCEPVIIGNDVGLSPDTSIITHGYWLSALEGYPAKFAGVTIEDGVIVGYRSIILMGVTIGKNSVIGTNSIVTRNVEADSIYAGNPAKFLKKIEEPSVDRKRELLSKIISEYRLIAKYHEIDPKIDVDYPYVFVNKCKFNVLTLEIDGIEDDETDDFRDYVRKWGLRFFTDRPFRSNFQFYNETEELM